jgi:Rieske Fe-S protein
VDNSAPRTGASPEGVPRRSVLERASTIAMSAGLIGSYGTLGYMAGRFLYPAKDPPTAWVYVARVSDFPARGTLGFRTPAGELVTLTRRARPDGSAEFLALSSTCPHLGCRVHWESQNERFFCPCHNGAFAPDGTATEGPPADAGQSLPRFTVREEAGLLFLEVPLEILAAVDPANLTESLAEGPGLACRDGVCAEPGGVA